MADILAFPVRPSASKSTEPSRRQNRAEIVIFPGVRYERWGQSADGPIVEIPRDLLRLME